MNKYKVGDKVKYTYDGKVYIGTVIEINSGNDKTQNLCRFEGFPHGHNGNDYTNRGKNYDTNDYWYVYDNYLELIEEAKCAKNIYITVDGVARKATPISKTNTYKGDTNMNILNSKYISDIRVGDKTMLIPQKNAAPQKVECKTVTITFNGKDYEAVCMPEDEFSLERGLEVALIKAICGGSKGYNKAIRELVQMYKKCEKKRKDEQVAAEIAANRIAKAKARKAKKLVAERKARIDEMSEAFLQAMRNYDGIGMDSMIDEDTTRVVNIDMDKVCEAFLKSKGLVAVPTNNDK